MGQLITLWTIRGSLFLYAVVVLRLLTWPPMHLGGNCDSKEPPQTAWVRWTWLVSCLLFLVHVACAFHFYHDWSHTRAVAHTASETERLMGVRFGYGIYFNHLFAAAWLIDAVAWVGWPEHWRRRSPGLHAALHGYMFFIAFNGAVIFEDGPVRVAGILVTVVVSALLLTRWLKSRQVSNHPEPT